MVFLTLVQYNPGQNSWDTLYISPLPAPLLQCCTLKKALDVMWCLRTTTLGRWEGEGLLGVTKVTCK